jgi:hypothetical protein
VMYKGAYEGDMQYWNGNAWMMITAPDENADNLSFCDGQPTWTQGGCPQVVYEVGDTGPAGGIVFYVSNEGLNGLEAAPVDQGLELWGCYGEAVPGSFSRVVGAGEANTNLILAHSCKDDYFDVVDDEGYHGAAIVARNYTYGGSSDWFLPSQDELNLIYVNLYLNGLGGLRDSGFYWGSNQVDEGRCTVSQLCRAPGFSMRHGDIYNLRFDRAAFVRPVRSF